MTNKIQDYDRIIRMHFGSHVYGTNLPTSDSDIKNVIIPPARDILLQRVCNARTLSTKLNSLSKNAQGDIDEEFFSLQKYLSLLLQGQTVALDVLFTPASFWIGVASPIWEDIQKNRDKFIHSGTASFAGYCKQQANKYGIKGSRVSAVRNMVVFLEELSSKYGYQSKMADYWDEIIKFSQNKEFISIAIRKSPQNTDIDHLECCNRLTPKFLSFKGALEVYNKLLNSYGERAKQAESNQNIDWKALMHAVRVCEQAKELLTTGHITFPRPEANLLLKIRKGEIPYKKVAELIEKGLEELTFTTEKSILPKEPNYKFAEDIIYQVYKFEVVNG